MKKQGFTMIEMLLCLQVISILVLLSVQLFQTILPYGKANRYDEDAIALYHMRKLLVQSEIKHIQEDQLEFVYQEENYTLSFHNGRIVKQKGYEIYLQEVDQAWFEERMECVYLHYEREEKQQEALLVCE